jgi:uncharacterized membrane protein
VKKEMKMYLKESLQLVEDNIIIAHKGTIIAAALLYVLSIIVMYNSNNEHLTIAVARMLLYNASIMFIAAETLRLAKNWTLRTKFIIGVFAIEVLGYLLMTVAACREEYYNRGIMFMLASFLISISKELSIVSLLVPNNQLKSKRYHFLSSLNSCCSALVFFFSALVSNFWGE